MSERNSEKKGVLGCIIGGVLGIVTHIVAHFTGITIPPEVNELALGVFGIQGAYTLSRPLKHLSMRGPSA